MSKVDRTRLKIRHLAVELGPSLVESRAVSQGKQINALTVSLKEERAAHERTRIGNAALQRKLGGNLMARWLDSKKSVGGDYPSSSRSRHIHLAEEALDLLTSYGPTKKSALITELFLKRSGKGGAVVQNEKVQQISLALVDSTARELSSLIRQRRPTKEHPIARQVIITIVADAVPNRLLYNVAIWRHRGVLNRWVVVALEARSQLTQGLNFGDNTPTKNHTCGPRPRACFSVHFTGIPRFSNGAEGRILI